MRKCLIMNSFVFAMATDAPFLEVLIILSSLLVCTTSLPAKHDTPQDQPKHIEGLSHSANAYGGEQTVHRSGRRAATHMTTWYWTGGRVPYVFDGTVAQQSIQLAMNHWNNHTCIQFVPRTDEVDYVRFTSDPLVCNSMVGLVPYLSYVPQYSGQPVQLTSRCANSTGTVINLLGTLLGLYPEHQRPDRDQYVGVLWENIMSAHRQDFNINPNIDTSYGPYDLGSIMHYALDADSRNGLNTMALMVTYSGVVGQRDGLSSGDIQKSSQMYGCPSGTSSSVSTPSSPSTSSPSLSSGPDDSPTASPILVAPSSPSLPAGPDDSPTASPILVAPSSPSLPAGPDDSPTASPILVAPSSPSLPSGPDDSPTQVPTVAPPPIRGNGLGPTDDNTSGPGIDNDVIRSGSNIALKILTKAGETPLWLGCTAEDCSASSCPGATFAPKSIVLCPRHIYLVSHIDSVVGGDNAIRAGDQVVLMQLGGSTLYCNDTISSCAMSSVCRDGAGKFSRELCGNMVLVVRSRDKAAGQAIQNGDNIMLDYVTRSVPLVEWKDTLYCHSQDQGGCERRYCSDASLLDQSMSDDGSYSDGCRQIYTVFKLR